MRRDIELIREVLLSLEQDRFSKPTDLQAQKELDYHVRLLEDAGLVTSVTWGAARHGFPIVHHIDRLTWAGHEFLDLSRDESIWSDAKQKLLQPSCSWTFPILQRYLTEQVERQIQTKLSNPDALSPPVA